MDQHSLREKTGQLKPSIALQDDQHSATDHRLCAILPASRCMLDIPASGHLAKLLLLFIEKACMADAASRTLHHPHCLSQPRPHKRQIRSMATMNTLSFANIPQATASNNHLRTVFQSFATVYLRTSVESDSTQNIPASDAD